MTKKILFVGEGGQGIQTIAKTIAHAADSHYQHSSYIPSFGVEQRGTPSIAFVIVSDEEIHYPRFETADILVILQPRGLNVVEQYIDKSTQIIFDSSIMEPSLFAKYRSDISAIPATAIAHHIGNPRVFNVVVTAVVARMIEIDRIETWKAIVLLLGSKLKDNSLLKQNEDAYHSGWQFELEKSKFSPADFQPETRNIIKKGYGKKAIIMPAKCKGCNICISKCPVRALSSSTTLNAFSTFIPEIDLEKCVACGNCTQFCPDNAISVTKE
ncbi:MAG: 2-oxoacid:acceptor oxidoreductase family protein [Candidatus Berkelbacteria bacterium]